MCGPSRFQESRGVGVMHQIFACQGRPFWMVFMFFLLGVCILVKGLEYVGMLSFRQGLGVGGMHLIFACKGRPTWRAFMFIWLGL